MQAPGSPGPLDTRNLIIAMGLSLVILLGFQLFVAGPQGRERARQAEIAQQQAEAAKAANPAAAAAPVQLPRESALAATAGERIRFASPDVDGTILLTGARFDDLSLRAHRTTVDPKSPEVTVLSPADSARFQDAFFGWEEQNPSFAGIGATDQWSAPAGAELTPDTPLTLTLATPDGLEVTRVIALDGHSMFTVTDTVRNTTGADRVVRPFGTVRREGLPEDYRQNQIVHQGMVGVFGPEQRTLHEARYESALKHAQRKADGKAGEDARILELQSTGGWLGLGDHYWLTAMAPAQTERIAAYYDSRLDAGSPHYRAAYRGEWRTIPAGGEVTYAQHLFAGAKRVQLLRSYQRELNIPDLDKAVDWGMFFFLTRPFFAMLDFFGRVAGNFGLGILLTTIVIKLVLFPIVFQSNLAMTKLRKIQPKMKEIQDRFAADKQRQQQEMIRLYQTEKINPVSGCVPILMQIPVFYALYKTLTVTIEMRHAPFFGWIRDLSAPDPVSVFNLFGLLPYDPGAIPVIGAVLMLGPWAIGYGVTMWALQALSPPPTDPTQAMIFRWMPVLFTFMFASFPAGLVIYWVWSNTLSLIQQYVIMRTQGVETELDKLIAKRFGKAAEPAK
jgi:YidC/Oxa1 family membrane protein insertase